MIDRASTCASLSPCQYPPMCWRGAVSASITSGFGHISGWARSIRHTPCTSVLATHTPPVEASSKSS